MSRRSFTVRSIDDSLEEYISIAGEALCSSDRANWHSYVDRIGIENLRVVDDGPRLAGGMAFYRMGQWFGGRQLPCAGFSGVAISPCDRGSGAGGALLRAVLQEIREEGMPLASLYASTQTLYRRVGFEHAGTQSQYKIPIRSIECQDRALEAHRFQSPPLDKLNVVADARAEMSNGNLRRTDGLWQRLLDPYDGRGTTTYLLGDISAPEGFLILKPGHRDGGHPQPLISTDAAANSPAALRRLLSLVRDHRSMFNTFEWFGPPNDPLHFLADEQQISVTQFIRWMLRIVDLPKALVGRGYDDSIEGELHLEIADETLTENSGRWILRVADGQATIERGGEGHLAMDVRFLAPLYSSFYSAEELVRCGSIQAGDASQVRTASKIFAGPAPWVPELY